MVKTPDGLFSTSVKMNSFSTNIELLVEPASGFCAATVFLHRTSYGVINIKPHSWLDTQFDKS